MVALNHHRLKFACAGRGNQPAMAEEGAWSCQQCFGDNPASRRPCRTCARDQRFIPCPGCKPGPKRRKFGRHGGFSAGFQAGGTEMPPAPAGVWPAGSRGEDFLTPLGGCLAGVSGPQTPLDPPIGGFRPNNPLVAFPPPGGCSFPQIHGDWNHRRPNHPPMPDSSGIKAPVGGHLPFCPEFRNHRSPRTHRLRGFRQNHQRWLSRRLVGAHSHRFMVNGITGGQNTHQCLIPGGIKAPVGRHLPVCHTDEKRRGECDYPGARRSWDRPRWWPIPPVPRPPRRALGEPNRHVNYHTRRVGCY